MAKALKFYDLKRKESFTTSNYTTVKKKNKRGGSTLMAKTKHKPSDKYYCWRIIGRA